MDWARVGRVSLHLPVDQMMSRIASPPVALDWDLPCHWETVAVVLMAVPMAVPMAVLMAVPTAALGAWALARSAAAYPDCFVIPYQASPTGNTQAPVQNWQEDEKAMDWGIAQPEVD